MTSVAIAETERSADVQEVVSETGVHAYLVQDSNLPMLSISLHFKGGSATDPIGKEGLAYMVSGLIDEGAGPYDSRAFHMELEDNAIRLGFDAGRDSFTGELKTLTEMRDHAFELLRLALSEPRFDEEPVERIRNQIITELRRRENDPDYIASKTWFAKAFPDHPYGRSTRGTETTINAITVEDLKNFVSTRLASDNLVIGVSGDVTADQLRALLDKTFSGLPRESQAPEITDVKPALGETIVTNLPIPQSIVRFGHEGISRDDPDYYAAYVANYLLGGGGFSSRLMQEIREKRGLAYGAYSYLLDIDHAPLWMGGVATRNDAVGQSIEILKAEAQKMAAGEISQDDLDNAKTYLTGSFPLRLTSNDQVARVLVDMQVASLGIDYLDKRNDFIEALTLDDIKRVSARLFKEPPLVSIVGAPEGLEG
ncbi:MAG: pitrilysin family protein [Pseudomonadota bacterium]